MSFLGGLGKGLSRAFDGTNLAITQAILAGDYQGAAALRARQEELQRQLQQDSEQRDARDRQVIGAKNLGFSGDEIDGMSRPEMSEAIRQRALARMSGAAAGSSGANVSGTPPTDPAPQPAAALAAPPPGAPPPGAGLASGQLRFPGPSGFAASGMSDGAGMRGTPFAGPPLGQIAAPGNLPRLQTHAQAASLPRGAFFLAPDGSIRRND